MCAGSQALLSQAFAFTMGSDRLRKTACYLRGKRPMGRGLGIRHSATLGKARQSHENINVLQ